ncbi:aminopeptidase [Senegalia massiliensis]|uniref:M18 family aminopeptidase n=1 Tax=Senegalia massiliensis TaxID=1720316 RepID=A0A845QUT6_9CLOT|nr:aminopeptidase [Senegalia massiliensis]NBI05800.1 aminopeptidase [Senegalia massiliensis]
MSEETKGKKLQKTLTHKWENVWEKIDQNENQQIFEFGDDYKEFLNVSKTERLATDEIIRIAEENGYENLDNLIKNGSKLKPGQKIYANNKGKSVVMYIIGTEDITEGMNIIGSHVDAPRIDLKQFPLYEDSELALLKTHYYGGIKKYQWVSLPLALHGVIVKNNGEKVNISIGEDENDPIFMITDLLPHLAKDQMAKKLSEGITGEGLNIVIGSIPYSEKDLTEKIKLNILSTLNEKYDITEQDFTTAEFQAVPAGKARDLGLDRSLIAAYAHDDRVCAYTSLRAILDIDNPTKTAVALFADKEEIGSVGNTGMNSLFFENITAEVVSLVKDNYNELLLKRTLLNSRVLSADVSAGFDPNYPEVLDKRNAPFIGKGITLVKYTGARGKGGSNDANAEYISDIRRIFNENNIVWQMGELGKVDQGGGGTIAYMLSKYGMEVVDCGVPVLSMHAPYEVVSKADVYMTYKGYYAFYKA